MEDEDEFLDPVAGMVEEEDPAHETRGDVATREKPGTPGAVPNEDRSRHERFASLTIDRPALLQQRVCRARCSAQAWSVVPHR